MALAVIAVAGCGDTVVTKVLHRDNCNTCHQPLDEDGVPGGIEDIHPWHSVGCAECHGGNPRICDGTMTDGERPGDEPTCDGTWIYDKSLAHPPEGPDVRGLTPAELDAVDPVWLRFVNPSDNRVLSRTCGRCHTEIAAASRRSDHGLQTGDLAIARARSGLQAAPTPRFGATAQLDPSPDPNDACAVSAVTRLSPLPIDPDSTVPTSAPTTGNVVDHLLAKVCMDCHTTSYGQPPEAAADGPYRSSGCAACHMPYAPDGRSVSADPWVDRREPGHPLRHTFEATPREASCRACHGGSAFGGLSLARSFRGEPPIGVTLAATSTPPDVHFEAGMTCLDCHHGPELHGDGRLRGSAMCGPSAVSCEDCHGSPAERPTTLGSRQRLTSRDDTVHLELVDGRDLVVPELARATDPKTLAAHAVAHDEVACSTCHAGWMPNCYGCHVDMDLSFSGKSLTTGIETPGSMTVERLAFSTEGQVLARNARGEIQGAMLAETLFVTLRTGTTKVLDMAPRTGGDGGIARGLRPVDPHTTRRVSPLGACTSCHSAGDPATPTNEETLDRTHGYGSERFTHAGVRMDAALAPDGTPLVAPLHPGVRPLSIDEITKMRAVSVPP